jgi:predicted kinase
MAPKIVVLVGPPACGKTTFAKEFLQKNPTFIRVNKDEIRFMTRNKPVVEKQFTKVVSSASHNLIQMAVESGVDVLIDNTNIFTEELSKIRKSFSTLADISYIDCGKGLTVEQLIERDNNREKKVGETIIREFFEQYKKLSKRFPKDTTCPVVPPVVQDPSLPKVVIFDIDGTLAKMGKRSPYDWKSVGVDTPNEQVVKRFLMESEKADAVFVVSGRSETCRAETVEWLDKQSIFPRALYMRKAGDQRPDNIVKKEIFDEHFNGKYFVEVVYDDRDSVVRLWRSLGLTCFQVAKSPD